MRILQAVRALVLELIEPHRYHAHVRYRVVKNTAGRVELQAVAKKSGYPDTLPISIRCGIPGGAGTPALGATVLVVFLEGDPTLPVVTHFSQPGENAFVPLAVSLDASGTVTIGASADLVALGSGSELAIVDPVGRVMRWGDVAYIAGADTPLVPGGSSGVPPYANVSKVSA